MGKIDKKKAGLLYESLTGRISYLFSGKSLIPLCKHYITFSLSGQGLKKSRQWSDVQELHGFDFSTFVNIRAPTLRRLFPGRLFGAFWGGFFLLFILIIEGYEVSSYE